MVDFKRAGLFTDLHFGKKANSQSHNEDCLNFIRWASEQFKDQQVDHIVFLGDWHENRNAINVSTLKYSHQGMEILNSLGLPIYVVVGNHDMYLRHSRDIHSITHFSSFENVTVIETPTVIKNKTKDFMLVPFLFHEEYPNLKQYVDIPIWMGHFEFKGFQISGYNISMQSGPDSLEFTEPEIIFSGHFHKRQQCGNVEYIGNCFPMDFSDAGDTKRGVCIFNYENNSREYIDWQDSPAYYNVKLSDLVSKKVRIKNNAHVKCIVDMEIDFEESAQIREVVCQKYKLRDFTMEESKDLSNAITETVVDDSVDKTASVHDLVIQMLSQINVDTINNEKLISIYKNINI
jgi:DNA repair exonuclease SbcCD nuclease subunit